MKKCIWLKSSTNEKGELGKPNYCKNCNGEDHQCQMFLEDEVEEPYQIYNNYHDLLMPYFKFVKKNINLTNKKNEV